MFDEPVPNNFIHTFQSECPVLFINYSPYPEKQVPNLKDSQFTIGVHSRLDRSNTVIPHRPELLLQGYRRYYVEAYRRYYVEAYVMNWHGLDDDMPGPAFGDEDRLHLDMTMYNTELGLYMIYLYNVV